MLVEYNFYVPKGMDEQEETAPEPAPAEPTAEVTPELPEPTDPTGAATPAVGEPAPELPSTETPEPMPVDTSTGGEVEVDITELINSTKDTKDKIDGTNELLNTVVSKFEELEAKMASFNEILDRLNQIEHDFEKRLPTPVEKLEMRSMDSFPYSIKLSDFWSEETEDIDTDGITKNGKEYILTPEEVKKDYNPSTVKNSFGVENPEDQDFNR